MLGLLFLQGVTEVPRIKSFWLVRTCVLMTPIKCLKSNKSLQLFVGISLWGPTINVIFRAVKLKNKAGLNCFYYTSSRSPMNGKSNQICNSYTTCCKTFCSTSPSITLQLFLTTLKVSSCQED